MAKKKKVEEEEVYHVEVITKARVSEDGEWEYLVKWAGYESDADSWEPTENVKQCDRLLASFWKHVGTDDHDYPIGYEVAAEEEWIKKEKRYFKDTFLKPSKRKSEKKTTKDRQESRKSKSSTPHVSESSAGNYTSSDEEPLVKSPVAKGFNRMARVIDTESESGSDGQSRKLAKAVSRPQTTTAPSKDIPKVAPPVKRQETMPSIGGSTSVAPPRPAVRTHQDQRANPLVKPMNLPSASVGAGSSLSTKQRVAAGIPSAPTGPKPLPVVPKKSLSALSFKKNKLAIPPGSQTKDVAVPSTSVVTPTSPVVSTKDTAMISAPVPSPTSPVVQTRDVTDDAAMVASPPPMDIDEPVDLWDSTLADAGPPGESSDSFTVQIPPKSQAEINVENFLQTVHIPELSGPLEPADQPDETITQPTRTTAILKIPKKWKWSGDLFISTSENRTELLCAVTIADPSGTSTSSHINLLLSSLDSLRISRLYSVMELQPIFRACGKPQFFGTLEPTESNEEVIIHGLEHHMTNEGLAAVIPLLLDAAEGAVLIVFPAVQQGLNKFLKVPEDLFTGTHLLVVLLPFLVPSMTSSGQRSIETVMQSSCSPWDVVVPHKLHEETMLCQAMSMLHFPKTLLDFLNSTSLRTYCIWPSPNENLPGLDTIMLQCILKSTKALSTKLEEDTRVVFVSNQHLEMLHTMPSLVSKLVTSPEIQFWTYGHSASMPSQKWRVQEIYPLGGIVTFTSTALAEDLLGCYQLISQIIEHPLWDCYLIPEALAVAHLLCSDGGSGGSGESCLGPVLDSIDQGSISVFRMPAKGCSDQVAWLSQVFNQSSANGLELLDIYLGILRSHSSTPDMTTEQLVSFTNEEITKDLSFARIQPTFMESYRRFVVIRAASEDTIPCEKDGLEWSTFSTFSFKDDYFSPA